MRCVILSVSKEQEHEQEWEGAFVQEWELRSVCPLVRASGIWWELGLGKNWELGSVRDLTSAGALGRRLVERSAGALGRRLVECSARHSGRAL